MKIAVLLPVFVLMCLFPLIAAPDAESVQLTFTLYAVGLPVAESHMSFDLTPSAYLMGLQYQTTGVARLFAGDKLDQTTKGMFEHDQPVPMEFHSFVRLHGQDRTVVLEYRNGDPTATTTTPPNEGERDIVPQAEREHTLDPLSAMVDMLHTLARTGRCDLSHKTYDGRRLEVFEVHTVDEEDIASSGRSVFAGRALRCDYTSRPLMGFHLGEQRADDQRVRKGSLWLAPVVPGGPRLPVQGVVDVRFLGTATMYLTAITP
ncbi:MAG: DUF3108 domain-containing protein [Acetobacteraceae bacterium]|jgi:hypothetical protein